MSAPVLAYLKDDKVYVNLTNRCPVACVFCLKRPRRWEFEGKDLRLGAREPSAREAFEAASVLLKSRPCSELVFCGYGESTLRLEAMVSIGRAAARRFPGLRRRLNTIGLGSLIWGRNIAPELAECLDAVSVSLNTADPLQWRRLHAPQPGYARHGFSAALRFIADCRRASLHTTITAVRSSGVKLERVERLAKALGVRFRERPFLA